MTDAKKHQQAELELARAATLPPYEAVDVAWVAVIKLANLLPGDSEYQRLKALVGQLPAKALASILATAGVDVLLHLDPPLESIVSDPYERLDVERTRRELDSVRSLRESKPQAAALSLVAVVKRVRNRRAHGFKTPEGGRDAEILSASKDILLVFGRLAVQELSPKKPTRGPGA